MYVRHSEEYIRKYKAEKREKEKKEYERSTAYNQFSYLTSIRKPYHKVMNERRDEIWPQRKTRVMVLTWLAAS